MASSPRVKSEEVRPIEIGGFSLDAHGAKPISAKVRPTKQGWLAAASFVKHVEVAAPYWVGDLLNWLEESSGWDEHTVDQLTAETGWARGTIYNHKSIASKLSTEVRQMAPSFSHARAVAPLPPKEQKKVLTKAVEEELTASQTAKVAQRVMRPRIVEGQAKLEGKYRVIYADPPWQYSNSRAMPDGSQTSAHDSYEGMPTDEIAGLPIEAHALDSAVLFMWSTNSHLPDALKVGAAWGFEYRTNYVWDKVLGRPGHYSYSQHELLLVFVRGSGSTPDVPIRQHDHASIITIRRQGEHSEKPEEVRKLIEKLYVDGPYLELFGRKKVKGWTVFGNDARLWAKGA